MTSWILDLRLKSKRFVLDSWPLLETLRKGRNLPRLNSLLREAALVQVSLLMSEVNQGELFYTIAGDRGASAAQRLIDQILLSPITVVPLVAGDGLLAGQLKARWRISLADCFCLMTAQRYQASLVTGDTDFRRLGLESEVSIEWLGA